MTLGEQAYEGYCEALYSDAYLNNKEYTPLPRWSKISKAEKQAWEFSAKAVIKGWATEFLGRFT